jgi:hypothetical protein
MSVITRPTSTTSPTAAPPRRAKIAGWTLTGLLTAFFLFDVYGKLLQIPEVVAACEQMGFPGATVPVIGGVLLLCTVLFVVPRTAIIGAVGLSAYLGGAVCAQLRIEADLFGTMLFPVYFGVLVWVAMLLRSRAARELVKAGS